MEDAAIPRHLGLEAHQAVTALLESRLPEEDWRVVGTLVGRLQESVRTGDVPSTDATLHEIKGVLLSTSELELFGADWAPSSAPAEPSPGRATGWKDRRSVALWGLSGLGLVGVGFMVWLALSAGDRESQSRSVLLLVLVGAVLVAGLGIGFLMGRERSGVARQASPSPGGQEDASQRPPPAARSRRLPAPRHLKELLNETIHDLDVAMEL